MLFPFLIHIIDYLTNDLFTSHQTTLSRSFQRKKKLKKKRERERTETRSIFCCLFVCYKKWEQQKKKKIVFLTTDFLLCFPRACRIFSCVNTYFIYILLLLLILYVYMYMGVKKKKKVWAHDIDNTFLLCILSAQCKLSIKKKKKV